MNVLNELREEFNISYDCNYFKGIRISYTDKNDPFFDNQIGIHIYKYDNSDDRYRLIVSNPLSQKRSRDFNKSSEEARKEIETSLITGFINLEIRDIIKDFLDSFYDKSKSKFIKEENREYILVEYTEKGDFRDDVVYGNEGFKEYIKNIIGVPIDITNSLKVKDKDIEVTFLTIRNELLSYTFSCARLAAFYILVKKKGEYLFRPLCDFLIEYKSLASKIVSERSFDVSEESGTLIKPYEDSDFKSYKEIVDFLEDILADNLSVLNCFVEVLEAFLREAYPVSFHTSTALTEIIKDYEDILYLYGEKDWYAKEEIDFLIMTNKNKGE